jgi:outer membrane receptor protein involved in Fe transport
MTSLASVSAIAMAILLPSAQAMAANAPDKPEKAQPTAWEADRAPAESDMVTTGVARGRDRLDSATSTSSIREVQITRIAPLSLAELFRNIPGMRVEAGSGDSETALTIRGLPLVGDGSKYVVVQEDGLPVMEFGDIQGGAATNFVRADLNIAQVESIRGGSASTFASNSPGGVINLVSKTGEASGGSVMTSAGLDYGLARGDFDYGGRLSDNLRFHIGGFYRTGEGPRNAGFSVFHGGQVKFNITRQLENGFIRFSAKVLDDSTGISPPAVLRITGSDADPKYESLAGFSATRDLATSPNIPSMYTMGREDQIATINLRTGSHVKSVALGVETQFEVAGWTVSERFRYSSSTLNTNGSYPGFAAPADVIATTFGGPGAALSYASGPKAGQAITSPSTLNGNGILLLGLPYQHNGRDLGFVVNDLRASRVLPVSGGSLTLTGGVYRSRQALHLDSLVASDVQDLAGNGQSALVDITAANGFKITQDGALFHSGLGSVGNQHSMDVDYDVTAPYGSFNFQHGHIAIGASVRYDTGRVRGSVANDGPENVKFFDLDGNGVPSSFSETTWAYIPRNASHPVNYNYHYLSYSTGVNWRIAPQAAVFARYSLGGRAAADSILFAGMLKPDGSLIKDDYARAPVRQAEVGAKFRTGGLSLNLTSFYATSRETSTQVITNPDGSANSSTVSRSYRAYGAEFEGQIRKGNFSLTASGTLTKAQITGVEGQPELVGNRPRHAATLIYQLGPQYDSDLFTTGLNVIGTTGSFAQDSNQLRMPGYATVGAYLQVRPVDRFVISLNVSNLFDKLAIVNVGNGTLPLTGVGTASVLNPRTVTASLRFFL